MIRRILAGAAIAAVAFGFSATAASADTVNPNNGGQAVLSQFHVIDDLLTDLVNGSFNESLRDIQINGIQGIDLKEVDLDILNNNQPGVGSHNWGSDATVEGFHS